MAQDGECIIEDFSLIAENPFPEVLTPDLPDRQNDCCNDFKLDVFASVGDSDMLKNDRKWFIWWFDPVISAVTMQLEKNSGSGWSTLATLNTNTYGIFKQLGFFVNAQNEQFIGYQMEWRSVLIAHGPGNYRVKVNMTASIGTPALSGFFYSPEFCLAHYSPHGVNRTVRLEYNISGRLGRIDTDKKFKDFGTLDWYDQLRVPGWFGFPSATYEAEYVTYNNGSRKYVELNQEPEYILQILQIPAFVQNIIRVDVLMADTLAITDYNGDNAEVFVQKHVQNSGEFAPKWHQLQSKLATIELKFRQEHNNLRKLRF